MPCPRPAQYRPRANTAEDAIVRILRTGKAAGILASVEADARHWIEAGCRFVAVDNDTGILARQTEALAAKFKCAPTAAS